MKFFLNGQKVAVIDGLKIGLISDFTNRHRPDEVEMDTSTLLLAREGVKIVKDWRDDFGLGNGIPAHIEARDGTQIQYYVDLWDPASKPLFKDYTVKITLKRRGGMQHFFDQAEDWSFEMLQDAGVVFDLVDILYVIIKENVVELGLTLFVSGFLLSKELIDQFIALSELIGHIVRSVTPNIAIIPVPSLGEIITLVTRVIFQLIVVGFLIFALIKLGQQFFETIFPKVRTFEGCKVKELMSKSAAHFGFDFESDLLDSLSGLTILPVPLIKNKGSFLDSLQNDLNFAYTKGIPTASDTTDTIGLLFDAMEQTLNGRTLVRNSVVKFERRDFQQDITPNSLELGLNLPEERQQEFEYNTEEGSKRYLLKYQVDPSDFHTSDFFDPTTAERQTDNVNIPNADLETIKGVDKVLIPFSLGVRKETLNFVEKIAKEFFQFIDLLIGTNLESQIDARKGVLQIGQQFYSVSKLMFIVNGKQPEDYVDIIGANAIYNNLHVINEIANNDAKIFKNVPIRLRSNEFVNLLDNNFINVNGVPSEILRIHFFDEQETDTQTTVTVKVPDNWADGQQTVKIIGE